MTAQSDLAFDVKKPARIFRFVWIGNAGPKLRQFTSIEAFSGYVSEVRALCGHAAVEFRTPILAFGVLT